jgi:hypothetical protein
MRAAGRVRFVAGLMTYDAAAAGGAARRRRASGAREASRGGGGGGGRARTYNLQKRASRWHAESEIYL